MNAFVPVIIFFVVLYLVGKWQQKQRRWRGCLMLKTAATKAQMDAMKLELGKRLLPTVEAAWRDMMVLTKENL